ncbi:hypothetical protein QBC39DRAFT_369571 [Podospora conica]|nr:hypothetical protein QBC39DRAFT_369571 [Schizothecium conicum]
MASRPRNPPIREPSVFDNSRNISSVLTGMTRETQIQTRNYTRPGDSVSASRATDKTRPGPGYTLVVGHHDDKSNFLDWTTFDEATLPPRDNFRKARRDKILGPLDRFKVELPGEIGLEGFGGLVESAHSIVHSHDHLEFMESEREILLPSVESTPEKLSQRELERLEVELFDLTKYNGYCEFLTAVTWAEDGDSGSVTLYKVNVGPRDIAVGIRPVAAMQGVPKSILVGMRTHDKIKRKAVFVPTDEDAQGFKWKANPSRGPSYVKLRDSVSSQPVPRVRSHSRERSSSRDPYGSSQVDAHGIKATIPQFVALMHSNRSILEQVQTTHITLLDTGDGDVTPAVTMVKAPRHNSHAGDGVHVAVLMPNEAEWAEEHIYWIDEAGLTEFRRRKYWDLIERGSRSRSRHSHSRHTSPDDRHKSRSRSRSRHSGHGDTRSRSRHLSLNDIF